VFDSGVEVILGPTVKSSGWKAIMGSTSFLVRAPADCVGAFTAIPAGWAFALAHVVAMRETLRFASKWLRQEWSPDFGRDLPFGVNRHPVMRRRGDRIVIHGLDHPDVGETRHELEFNYVELPGVRSSLERYLVHVRHRSVTTPLGDPYGPTEVHSDR
jgi:hypothetical protein